MAATEVVKRSEHLHNHNNFFTQKNIEDLSLKDSDRQEDDSAVHLVFADTKKTAPDTSFEVNLQPEKIVEVCRLAVSKICCLHNT